MAKKVTLAQHIIECAERYEKLVSQINDNRHIGAKRHKENTKALKEISSKLDGMVPKKWLYTALLALCSTFIWLLDATWPFIARLLK